MRRKIFWTLMACFGLAVFTTACSSTGNTEGGSSPTYTTEQIAAGQTQYLQTCSACHGADALGIDNLGKTLVGSAFILEKSDGELQEYVKVGRAVDDPLNTTGIAMPPKGGNPTLTDDQILAIIVYPAVFTRINIKLNRVQGY